jgi:hypothetical protein
MPGASRGFAVPAGQNYDLRADDCDHSALMEEYRVSISNAGFTWAVAP